MGKKGRLFAVVCGMADQGKTTLIENYLIPYLVESRPVIVLDLQREYQGEKYSGFDDFLDRLQERGSLEKKVHVIHWKNRLSDPVNLVRFIRFGEPSVSLILEESHVMFSDNDIHKKIKNPLAEITLMGAHYGIDVILSSQRPQLLSTTVRSQAQFFVSFRQEEPRDLTYLKEREPEAPGVVANLAQKEFFTFGRPPKELAQLKPNKINTLEL